MSFMSALCCSRSISRWVRLFNDCLNHYRLVDQKICLNEARNRIHDETYDWEKKDRTAFWAQYALIPGPLRPNIRLLRLLARLPLEKRTKGVAVDLGGGGDNATAVYLLRNKWKVIVVDTCKAALDQLQKFAARNVQPDDMRNLTLECRDMGDYKFPENVDVIMAIDALPYCDPNKFLALWD